MSYNLSPKLYTNVSIEALKKEITLEYRLWAMMRAYVQQNFGTAKGATKVHQLTHIGFRNMLKSFGFSRQLYYKFINNHSSTFFTVTDEYITFKGLANVCSTLNVMPGHVYRMNVEDMKKFDTFNAYCYYGYFANHINNVMQSRDTIERETNVSKGTQLKYEAILDLTKFENYFVFNPNGFNKGLKVAESVIENEAIFNIVNTDKTKNYMVYQSANTYLAYTSRIELFNDKETRRIYSQKGYSQKTAYRKDVQQSGKEFKPDVLNVRLLHNNNRYMRELVANQMDEHFINDFGYLKTLAKNKPNVRIFFVHNFTEQLNSIRNYTV